MKHSVKGGAMPPYGDRGTRPSHDFDLHGVVGIRLEGATRQDFDTVTRQLGPIHHDLDREPDITIRFVDRVTDNGLTFVGLDDSGFDADGFFLLRGKGDARTTTRFPMEAIGQQPVLVCERSTPAVPHLLTLVNLTALSKGVLPLHASAFNVGSSGFLVAGWSKGGKSESLLAAMAGGGQYVGDEWVYLTSDGRMLGVPEPIRLWDWQLRQMPVLRRARGLRQRLSLSLWTAAAAAARGVASRPVPGRSAARRAAPILDRQACVQVPPGELFGDERIDLCGNLDAVVLLMSHEAQTMTTRSAGRTEVAQRMASSLEEERAQFLTHYRHFRYAFPDRRSGLVESAPEIERKLLSELFDDRPAAVVSHPHPCDLTVLGERVLEAGRVVAAGVPDSRRAVAS